MSEMERLSPSSEGWHVYMDHVPPYGVPIYLYRPEWANPQLTKREDIHPSLNVDGLLWRPQ